MHICRQLHIPAGCDDNIPGFLCQGPVNSQASVSVTRCYGVHASAIHDDGLSIAEPSDTLSVAKTMVFLLMHAEKYSSFSGMRGRLNKASCNIFRLFHTSKSLIFTSSQYRCTTFPPSHSSTWPSPRLQLSFLPSAWRTHCHKYQQVLPSHQVQRNYLTAQSHHLSPS